MSTVSRGDLLSSQVRRRIVELVRSAEGQLAAADLAAQLDLHVTTVRFHLDQLEQAGVLVAGRERRETVGRPRKVYAVAAQTVPVNEAAYVVLAGVLAEAIPGAPAARSRVAIEAGEAWAQAHVPARAAASAAYSGELPVRELLDVLARWGYRRESVTVERPRDSGVLLSLESCPMRDAALAHPEVVCAVHVGLIRGALRQLGVGEVGVTVRPMVGPELCLVDLELGESHSALAPVEGPDRP